jgi:hypothetical protein
MIFIGGNVGNLARRQVNCLLRSQMFAPAIDNKQDLIAVWMSMMLVDTSWLKRARAQYDVLSANCFSGN